MLELLKDPALVLVALTRVKRLRDLILLTPINVTLFEWVARSGVGERRQLEWDRLVRAARKRKEGRRLPTCEEERAEWKEVEWRDEQRLACRTTGE